MLTFADGSGAKFATRRFDGDDTLDRVVRFLATCEVGCPPDGDGWRVVALWSSAVALLSAIIGGAGYISSLKTMV